MGRRGAWLLRPAAAAVADQSRRITTLTIASGTWNHGGVNYTNNPANAEVYAISQYFNYDDLTDIIDRGLERCWYEFWSPLTLITDGDMETAATANWSAVGTSTVSKVTTTGYRGDQALNILNSAANSGRQSATVNVPSPFGYFLTAVANITVGTAVLRPYDVTNATAIAGEVTTAEFGQNILWLTFTTPATARQIAIRLIGTGATDDITWDNLVLHRLGQRQFNLPSRFTRGSEVISVRRQVRWGNSISSGIATEDAYDWPYVDYDLELDRSGTVPARLHLREAASVWPIWVQEWRQYAASADDNTTNIDIDTDYVVAAAKVEFYEALRNRPGAKPTTIDKDLAAAKGSFASLNRAEARERKRIMAGIW